MATASRRAPLVTPVRPLVPSGWRPQRRRAIVLSIGAGASWGRFMGLHKNGCALDEAFADVYILNDQGLIKTRRSYFFRPAI